MNRHYLLPPLAIILTALSGCSSKFSQTSTESQQTIAQQRPFFQEEYGVGSHGKKTLFDRVIEFDPGQLKVDMEKDYDRETPAVIAVLPFDDEGSAQFTVDKIPLTLRDQDQRARWAWTDAQRLRRALVGYLSEREFVVINPIAVDAVLKAHGIDNSDKLMKISPLEMRKWFGCDAVVAGTVEHYEAYYFALVSAYNVGVNVRMISTHDGATLMRAHGSRWDTNLAPAMDPLDIAINSGMTLLQLRDVNLARAEEESAREIVLRIPVSEKLKDDLASAALSRAELDVSAEPLDPAPDSQGRVTGTAPLEHIDQQPHIDRQSQDLKTAASWHPLGAHSGSF